MDIGIALLVDEKTKKIVNTLSNNKVRNIPHISLYQLNIVEENLETLCNELVNSLDKSKIIGKQIEMERKLSPCAGNIFWRAKQNTILSALSNQVLEVSNRFRSKKFIQVIANQDLKNHSEEKQNLINQYGIYWIKQFFDPHITVSYTKSVLTENIKLPISVKIESLAIIKIGDVGNAIEVLNKLF